MCVRRPKLKNKAFEMMSDNIGWESCIKVDGAVKPSSMQANKLAVKFLCRFKLTTECERGIHRSGMLRCGIDEIMCVKLENNT